MIGGINCGFYSPFYNAKRRLEITCQERLLELKVRSQDSPSIADVLGVERVRRVKTFAQHATLGVLESNFMKRQAKTETDACGMHQRPSNGFNAAGCQQIYSSTQAGLWDHPGSATCGGETNEYE